MTIAISVSQMAVIDIVSAALEEGLINEEHQKHWDINLNQSLSLDSKYPFSVWMDICRLIQKNAREQSVPAGIYYKRSADFSKFGKLGFASIAVNNLEGFITLVSKAMPLFLPKVDICLEKGKKQAEIMHNFGDEYSDVMGLMNEYSVAEFKRFEVYFARPFKLHSVHFVHSPTGPIENYERYFGCPVKFLQSSNSIFLSNDELVNPTLTHNEEVFNILYAQLEQKIKEINSQVSMAHRVEAIWLEHADKQQFLQLNDVANEIAISSRTLARHLANEGTTFKDVCNKVREQMAIHLLNNSTVPVGDVALQVGFKDTNSLHRFFKSRLGITPGEQRSLSNQLKN